MPRFPKHKTIYANAVNLSGLWSPWPIRLKWNGELESYWDDSGDFDVDELGEKDQGGIITFASTSVEEVKQWTNGAKAVMKLIKEWSSNHERSE